MSFGFSISDFVCCGQLAYQLYTDFKEAAGDCQAFAKELFLLHRVILKTEALIHRMDDELDESDQATLGLCLDMCKDILFNQIAGADGYIVDWNPRHRQGPFLNKGGDIEFQHATPSINRHDLFLQNFSRQMRRLVRQKFEERTFARKIPKIRTAISTVTEKLTSFQVLMIR